MYGVNNPDIAIQKFQPLKFFTLLKDLIIGHAR